MNIRTHSSLVDQQYDAIRASRQSDIETVAKNTGLSESEVTAMKRHLFFGKDERFSTEVAIAFVPPTR